MLKFVFTDNRAYFRGENGLYGFIDTTGTIICEAKYDEIDRFMEEVARIVKRADGWKNMYDFINTAGKKKLFLQSMKIQTIFGIDLCVFLNWLLQGMIINMAVMIKQEKWQSHLYTAI